METYDVLVMGAGAAGLMAAAQAGQRGRSVLLVDRNDAPGRKILISGGGRCNFTNRDTRPENYVSQNRHFAKSALRRYTPADFIALVDRYGIDWHEKTLGQLFCDGSAKQIVGLLMEECRRGEVRFAFGEDATVERDGDGFVATMGPRTVRATSLVLATGGLSIPKLGASSFAYDRARDWGLKIVEPRPALVPLKLSGEQLLFRELAGVSAPVTAKAERGPAFAESALFTHRGLSGPAILQASSYWHHGETVAVDFFPGAPRDFLRSAKRHDARRPLAYALRETLPERLATTLAERLRLWRPLQEISDKELETVEQRLRAWPFEPSGSEGFAKAEVTVGGISTDELSSQTMEAKKVPGLYCIGEAVDVTGWLGGYNFQWAWASGWAAGQVA